MDTSRIESAASAPQPAPQAAFGPAPQAAPQPAHGPAAAHPGPPPMRAVHLVGVGQILSWGTTYYALGVLAEPLAAARGWPLPWVYAGLSVALLASAAVSARAGAQIDRRGARGPMCAGAALAGVMLAAVALAPTLWLYLAAWAGLGIAMRLTLYDAAFAAVVQLAPDRGARSIAFLSLWGGFASSVFWPLGHWLGNVLGWQGAFFAFAALNLCVALPLYRLGLPKRPAPRHAPARSGPGPGAAAAPAGPARTGLTGAARGWAMLVFALANGAYAFVMGATAVHLIGVVAARGIALETAIAATAFMGVAQVGARVLQTFVGGRLSPAQSARIPIWLLPGALMLLVWAPAGGGAALAFALAFGAAKGLFTIVRGTLPLALFGSEGYGGVLGRLATPFLLVSALAPLAFGVLVDRAGHGVGLWALVAAAALTLAAVEVLLRIAARVAARETGAAAPGSGG